MIIKDELCPPVKVDARLMGDGTLWIKTDKDSLEKVNRVIVEDGKTSCKQFYQDAPEQRTGEWKYHWNDEQSVSGYVCSECGWLYDEEENFCPNCGADMRGERDG